MREIPQRELRNNVSAILRQVENGTSLRITVRGRPVADLTPVSEKKSHLTPEDVERIVREAPLDRAFTADVGAVAGDTVDTL